VKVYADRDSDLKKLVADGDSQLAQLDSELQKLQAAKIALTARVAELQKSIADKTSSKNALQDSVDSAARDIANTNAELSTRTAAADAADKAVDTALTASRAAEARANELSEILRDLQLKTFTASEEKSRLDNRANELSGILDFANKQQNDLAVQNADAAGRLQAMQATVDALRSANSQSTAAISQLQAALGTATNDTGRLQAQQTALNNATIALLVEASDARSEFNAVSAEVRFLRQKNAALQQSKAKATLRKKIPDIQEDVLTSLNFQDESADPERSLQSAVRTGPSADELEAELFGGKGGTQPLARFREVSGSLGHANAAAQQPALETQAVVLSGQLNDVQSQLSAQQNANDASTQALSNLAADIDAANIRGSKLLDTKVFLAEQALEFKDRFDMLRDRVMSMRDTFFNSSNALSAVKDEIDELGFSVAQVTAREKGWQERATAAADEVTQLVAKRRDVMASISKAADDRITQTQVLKADIARLVVQRRATGTKIAKQEGMRLIVAQQVDYLQQQANGLQQDEQSLQASIVELTGQMEKLTRQQEIVHDQLRLVTARQDKATHDLPDALQHRDTNQASVHVLDGQVLNAQLAADAAELAQKTSQVELDKLSGERNAANARIAELKLKAASSQQMLVDLAEAKAQAMIESDRQAELQRTKALELTRANSIADQLRAAVERAIVRRARAEDNLAQLRSRSTAAKRVRDTLRGPSAGAVRLGNNSTNATSPVQGSPAPLGPSPTIAAKTAGSITQQLASLQSSLDRKQQLASSLNGV
jgi:chromosome segregation ATPase